MPGRLYYVVGASGAGKDTLIRHARETLQPRDGVVFAHRYITRAPDAGGENHVALTEPEFLLRESRGLFALSWESHGLRYGVGVEIDAWLARDLAVVVNGSRAFLPQVVRRYGERLHLVEIRVDPKVRAQRLANRGRETGDALHKRVAHRVEWSPPDGVPLSVVANDGTLAQAGERLLAVLRRSDDA